MSRSRQLDDQEMQKDVDHLIVDYLYDRGIQCLIKLLDKENTGSVQPDARSNAASTIQSAILFFEMCQHSQVLERAPEAVIYRIHLLHFLVFFVSRKAFSLKQQLKGLEPVLRLPSNIGLSIDKLAIRCRQGLSENELLLDGIRRTFGRDANPRSSDVAESSPIREDIIERGKGSTLTRILPLFMYLSTSILDHGQKFAVDVWMNLAGAFMSQTVIDLCLASGARPEAVHRAFSWECQDQTSQDIEGVRSAITRLLCANSSGSNESSWDTIKSKWIKVLIPPQGTDWPDHYRSVNSQHLHGPDFDLDIEIIRFVGLLWGLSKQPALDHAPLAAWDADGG